MPDLRQLLEALPGWIEAAIGLDPRLGYLVLGLAMLLENLIPPIPSELIQPVAGLLVQRGSLQLLPVILCGTAGTLLGCWFWYWLGRRLPEEPLLRWLAAHGGPLGIGAGEVEASRGWFRRHGLAIVFWGRLLPGLRTIISLPAGLERVPEGPFLLVTAAGSLLWVSALTLLGAAAGAGQAQLLQRLAPSATLLHLAVPAGAGLALLALLVRARRPGGGSGSGGSAPHAGQP